MRYLPLIDYSKPAPRRSKLVAAYRVFSVVVFVLRVAGLRLRGVI